jgi:hypothetical protein
MSERAKSSPRRPWGTAYGVTSKEWLEKILWWPINGGHSDRRESWKKYDETFYRSISNVTETQNCFPGAAQKFAAESRRLRAHARRYHY